jgi:hypothetical protein
MVGSSGGTLTCHGGSIGVSKPSKGKAMDFESTGGLGTGEEVQGQSPWSSKCRGLGPRKQTCWERKYVKEYLHNIRNRNFHDFSIMDIPRIC